MVKNQSLKASVKRQKRVVKAPVLGILLLLFTCQFSVHAAPASNGKQVNERNILKQTTNASYHVNAERTASGFSISPDDAEPIIEYSRNISMLENQDAEPMLRVYGNGRVHVHLPVYMKKSGDYEYTLTQAQLIALLRKLSATGMMDFDRERARAEKKSHDRMMKQKGELFYVSDSLESVVNIRLKNYQTTSKSLPQTNFNKRFSWKNLEQDAQRYKTNRSVQDAAIAIKELDKLINQPSMKRVR